MEDLRAQFISSHEGTPAPTEGSPAPLFKDGVEEGDIEDFKGLDNKRHDNAYRDRSSDTTPSYDDTHVSSSIPIVTPQPKAQREVIDVDGGDV